MKDENYLDLLKDYRMKKNPVAPYLVFPDNVMNKLVEEKPKTLAALASIEGFPKDGQRMSKYGEDIIKIFQINCKVNKMKTF